MATVEVEGEEFDVYVSLETADRYAIGSFSPQATAWRALTDDERSATIVQATREIDRQLWAGEKTDPDQEHAWPRTGVTRADGTEVDEDTVPQEILDGVCELAMWRGQKPASTNEQSSG